MIQKLINSILNLRENTANPFLYKTLLLKSNTRRAWIISTIILILCGLSTMPSLLAISTNMNRTYLAIAQWILAMIIPFVLGCSLFEPESFNSEQTKANNIRNSMISLGGLSHHRFIGYQQKRAWQYTMASLLTCLPFLMISNYLAGISWQLFLVSLVYFLLYRFITNLFHTTNLGNGQSGKAIDILAIILIMMALVLPAAIGGLALFAWGFNYLNQPDNWQLFSNLFLSGNLIFWTASGIFVLLYGCLYAFFYSFISRGISQPVSLLLLELKATGTFLIILLTVCFTLFFDELQKESYLPSAFSGLFFLSICIYYYFVDYSDFSSPFVINVRRKSKRFRMLFRIFGYCRFYQLVSFLLLIFSMSAIFLTGAQFTSNPNISILLRKLAISILTVPFWTVLPYHLLKKKVCTSSAAAICWFLLTILALSIPLAVDSKTTILFIWHHPELSALASVFPPATMFFRLSNSTWPIYQTVTYAQIFIGLLFSLWLLARNYSKRYTFKPLIDSFQEEPARAQTIAFSFVHNLKAPILYGIGLKISKSTYISSILACMILCPAIAIFCAHFDRKPPSLIICTIMQVIILLISCKAPTVQVDNIWLKEETIKLTGYKPLKIIIQRFLIVKATALPLLIIVPAIAFMNYYLFDLDTIHPFICAAMFYIGMIFSFTILIIDPLERVQKKERKSNDCQLSEKGIIAVSILSAPLLFCLFLPYSFWTPAREFYQLIEAQFLANPYRYIYPAIIVFLISNLLFTCNHWIIQCEQHILFEESYILEKKLIKIGYILFLGGFALYLYLANFHIIFSLSCGFLLFCVLLHLTRHTKDTNPYLSKILSRRCKDKRYRTLFHLLGTTEYYHCKSTLFIVALTATCMTGATLYSLWIHLSVKTPSYYLLLVLAIPFWTITLAYPFSFKIIKPLRKGFYLLQGLTIAIAVILIHKFPLKEDLITTTATIISPYYAFINLHPKPSHFMILLILALIGNLTLIYKMKKSYHTRYEK